MPRIIVTEQQWIEQGMAWFAEGGSEALVIEKMAIAFGCSKSSFYWYFNNRITFIKRIVEAWMERATKQVIHTASEQATVHDQIVTLLNQMFSVTRQGDFLFYLRKLSMKEVEFRSDLDEIERLRIEYVQGLLIKSGMSDEGAYQKAWLLYHYYLGWYERHKHAVLSKAEVERHVKMLCKEWMGE